ncbi:MAG: tetratricopeptide repeat protein [Saprospiraceae bacterium]|nr:tetratricopeptide repeat protein [Saprospiraceae bacterium]
MNNLGNIYVKMGDFSRSETNLLAALSLKAELFGKSNLDYLSNGKILQHFIWIILSLTKHWYILEKLSPRLTLQKKKFRMNYIGC